MSNYSILEENTLLGLSETAGVLYLKLLDVFQGHKSRDNERRAFFAACHYENKVGGVLDHILRNSPIEVDSRTISELSEFFAERWRHNFMKKIPCGM